MPVVDGKGLKALHDWVAAETGMAEVISKLVIIAAVSTTLKILFNFFIDL
ncbi:hypothetical protein DGWBC_1660 [Dehalogenimonas sp. WBC-2]|nr:hypothetical protein DGWBC_1660 [Dehalogenimonas sp. WBC-2]